MADSLTTLDSGLCCSICFNRQRSSPQARYVVNNVKFVIRGTGGRADSDIGLLNKVARAGGNLLGTRPYWEGEE
jgi:hypothetical protein